MKTETSRSFRKIRSMLSGKRPRRDYTECFFSAALTSGMRSKELFALQWGDVDWQAKQILVRRVLTRHKGGWRFYEPKTKTSKRRVDVDPSFLLELKKWKLQQPRSDFNDLIFTNGERQPLHRSTVRKQGLLPTQKGRPPAESLSSLAAHTYASLLIEAGDEQSGSKLVAIAGRNDIYVCN